MDIHQCPRCELRFANTSELRHHFEFDHAADPRVFERFRYRAGPTEDAARRSVHEAMIKLRRSPEAAVARGARG